MQVEKLAFTFRCRVRDYDSNRFENRVAKFPFSDHNPPRLDLLLPFCEDVDEWLSANPDNIVAVHCKAGKGRTGVMICAYLIYKGYFTCAEQAMAFYGQKRTVDMNGVTIPSQRRYVQYFARIVHENLRYRPVKMILRSIHFDGIPTTLTGTCCPKFMVHTWDHKKIYVSPTYECTKRTSSTSESSSTGPHSSSATMSSCSNLLSMNIPLAHSPLIVEGDVRITFYHNPRKLQRKHLFTFWFNPFFMCPGQKPSVNERISDPPHTNALKSSGNSHSSPNVYRLELGASAVPNGDAGCSMTNGHCTRSHSSPGMFHEPGHHVLTLSKRDLDLAHKDKQHKTFPEDFRIHLLLQCVPSADHYCPLLPTSSVSASTLTVPGGRLSARAAEDVGTGNVAGDFSIREESSETFSSESSSQTEDEADEETSTIALEFGGGSAASTRDCYMTQGYEEATLYGAGWSATDAVRDAIELGAQLRDPTQHADLRVSSSGSKNSNATTTTNNGDTGARKEDLRRCSLPSDSPSQLRNHRHT